MVLKQKVLIYSLAIVLLGSVVYLVWKTFKDNEPQNKKLAQQHCGSCHPFPGPELLSKEKWEKGVLPQMAFRMGFKNNNNVIYQIARKDLPHVLSTIPKNQIISDSIWKIIHDYYITNAPDSVISEQKIIHKEIKLFRAKPISLPNTKSITALRYDNAMKQLYIGTAASMIYSVNNNFIFRDSIAVPSPPTEIVIDNSGVKFTLAGSLLPNDQANGAFASWSVSADHITPILDSLKRPVFFHEADFDGDNRKDIVVCAFGNYTGSLSIYKKKIDNTYDKIMLSEYPGARKLVAIDWNHDGDEDIIALMAQGDERLLLFENQGKMKFKETVLARFPPIYGSSYFEIADFNKDGFQDILYTNGDNADYSSIIKPYHAVRIFENDGNNGINEVWTYPMPGAWQTKAVDFDKDGDLDIAAISLFPDQKNFPNQSFIYFENNGSYRFTSQIFKVEANVPWMVMETFDSNNDGDIDIVLGGFDFNAVFATKNTSKQSDRTLFLFLENLQKN